MRIRIHIAGLKIVFDAVILGLNPERWHGCLCYIYGIERNSNSYTKICGESSSNKKCTYTYIVRLRSTVFILTVFS